MIRTIRKLLRNKSGATAIEYGLIAALVSVAAIGALVTVGDNLEGVFGGVGTQLQTGIDEMNAAGAGSGGAATP